MSTKIEWADDTRNPIVGCSKCSPGCDNCYAERIAAMRVKHPNPKIAAKYAGVVDAHGKWTGKVNVDFSCFDKLPRGPRRIFMGSMGDMFHPNVPYDALMTVMSVAIARSALTFMFLTKRPDRMRDFFTDLRPSFAPKNIWLGTTVCGPDELWKIRELLQTPAAVRFVSFEPLLADVGPLDIDWTSVIGSTATKNALTGEVYVPGNCGQSSQTIPGKKIDWVICGGETGHNARPMHPAWVRSLRAQCREASTPFFFKGWGGYGPTAYNFIDQRPSFRTFDSFIHYCNKAPTWMFPGDKLICPDGHIPTHGGKEGKTFPMCVVRRIGKKQSGRLLDGREWNEVPA